MRKLYDIIGRPNQVLHTARGNSILNKRRAVQKATLEGRVAGGAQAVQPPISSHGLHALAPMPSNPLNSHPAAQPTIAPYPPFPIQSDHAADLPNLGFESLDTFKNTPFTKNMTLTDPLSAQPGFHAQGFENPFENTRNAMEGGETTTEAPGTALDQGGESGFGRQGRDTEA